MEYRSKLILLNESSSSRENSISKTAAIITSHSGTGARDLFGWWLEFVRFTFIRPQPPSLLLSIPFPHLRRSWSRPYTTWRGVTSACSTFREREEEAAHSCHCAGRDAMADERLELFQSSTLANVSVGMGSTDGIEKKGEGARYQVSCLHFWEEGGALWWLGRWMATFLHSFLTEYGNTGSNSDSDSSTQFCNKWSRRGKSKRIIQFTYDRGFDIVSLSKIHLLKNIGIR